MKLKFCKKGIDMYIKKLELENFRGIEDAEIDFDGKSAVLFGNNGMGKSTVLDAIDILFCRIFSDIVNFNKAKKFHNGVPTGLHKGFVKEDVKSGEKSTTLRMDIGLYAKKSTEYSYWRKIDLESQRQRTFCGKGYRKILMDFLENYVGSVITNESINEEVEEESVDTRELEYNSNNMPIYTFYSIHRYVEQNVLANLNETNVENKIDALDGGRKSAVDFKKFFTWFRARQEYENSIKVDDMTFHDPQLDAVRTAILTVLGDEFTSVKMRIQPTEFVATKKGVDFSIGQLSEGEKCTLALVGDLARRLAIANPQRDNPLEGTGVVLIDEIDLHLHPKWQLKIVPLLQRIFPRIQFIFSTHSPKVLGELDDSVSIFELKEEDDEIQIVKIRNLLGWDTNQILKMFMDTPIISKETETLIRNIRNSIKEENYDEAEELVEKLCGMTDELNEEVVRARAIIARRRRNL